MPTFAQQFELADRDDALPNSPKAGTFWISEFTMLVENAFRAVPSTTAPGFSISSRARSFANGQVITDLWNGSEPQSGANVTVTNLSYNGSNPTGKVRRRPAASSAFEGNTTNCAELDANLTNDTKALSKKEL